MNEDSQNNQPSEDAKWSMPDTNPAASSYQPPVEVPVPPAPDQMDYVPHGLPVNHSAAPYQPAPPMGIEQPAPAPAPSHRQQKQIYGHQKPRKPIGMRLIVAFFGLLLIGGVGYVGTTLFSTGEQKVALTLENAWGNPIYDGNGSDIALIKDAQMDYVCPEGYEQIGKGETSTCTATKTDTKSGVVLTCPSGYDQSGGGASFKCSKIVGGEKVAGPAPSAAYACLAGYTKSSSGAATVCTKTETASITKSYSCTAGYLVTGSGKETRCVKSTETPGSVIGTCPSGYTASGAGLSTTCKQTVPKNTTTRYYCPTGTEQGKGSSMKCLVPGTPIYFCPAPYTGGVGTRTCEQKHGPTCPDKFYIVGSGVNRTCKRLTNGIAHYINVPSCPTSPTGYKLSGSLCSRTIKTSTNPCYSFETSGSAYGYWTCTRSALSTKTFSYYYCPTGWSPSYSFTSSPTNACSIQGPTPTVYSGCGKSSLQGQFTTDKYDITCTLQASSTPSSYKCSSGTPSGSGCLINASTSNGTPWCSEGYEAVGSSCTKSASANFSCASGYAKVISGSAITCLRINMDTKDPITTNTCPSGFAAEGSGCKKVTTVNANLTNTCTSGYKLDGKQCVKIVGGTVETAQPNKSFSCPDGYAQIGSGDSMKCTKTTTDTQKSTVDYVCEDGWYKREVGTAVDCARVNS